jgi:hypothetical protein
MCKGKKQKAVFRLRSITQGRKQDSYGLTRLTILQSEK